VLHDPYIRTFKVVTMPAISAHLLRPSPLLRAFCAALCLLLAAAAHAAPALQAGFSRVSITPPVGTLMTGFGQHFHDTQGTREIHDPVYTRAVVLRQGEVEQVIIAMDICFLSRDQTDRIKGAIGRKLDLRPSQILLNASHNHTGPRTGNWFYMDADPLYLGFLEQQIVAAVLQARAELQEVTLWATETTSKLPVSRRRPNPATGAIDFAPNPDGKIYPYLPIVVLKDAQLKPLILLFSVAAHPSNIKGVERMYSISADYPGIAADKIDELLGHTGALFLQGAAGSCKCTVVPTRDKFPDGSWEDVDKAGSLVAAEVKAGLEQGLKQYTPALGAAAFEMDWPMQPALDVAGYEQILAHPSTDPESMPEVKAVWAKDMINRLKLGYELPTTIPITAHGIELGDGLRIVAIEGEMVAELGLGIREAYPTGLTIPLGYSNGAQLYLPTSKMMGEGGYEVESFWEYRHPAPLATGVEEIIARTVEQLKQAGIE
jgi:neutral ceramidase